MNDGKWEILLLTKPVVDGSHWWSNKPLFLFLGGWLHVVTFMKRSMFLGHHSLVHMFLFQQKVTCWLRGIPALFYFCNGEVRSLAMW